MKIRSVKNSDINNVAKLFNDYRVFYRKESDFNGAKSFISDRFTNNDSKIYVCEGEDKELVGFVQLYPIFSSTRMQKSWLLNDLFVNSSHRGKKISIQLIEKAKNLVEMSDAFGLFLETEKSNLIGNNLYPKTGFKLNEDSNFYEWNRSSLL